MRPIQYRRRTGGAWAAGLGVLGLLITVAIIMWLVNLQTDSMVSSTGGRGPGPLLKDVRKQVEGFNERNAQVGKTVEQQGSPATAPAPAPAPATAPAPTPTASGGASPGGTPSGGETIGPITPVTPVAPIQEGPGANYRSTTNPVNNMTDGMQKRNEELEKALRGN